MADRVLIQGTPYEVIEWDQCDPDADGRGTAVWTLYARALDGEQPGEERELRDTLLALRAQWDTRRKRTAALRDAADGQISRLASLEHDIYARILRELDAVLGTGDR